MQSYEIRKLAKKDYPLELKQISALPEEMDLAGDMPGPEYKFLCVVGARNHSQYGQDACFSLIQGLRGYPIVIVSGLAIGIDSLAHEAALHAGLKTVAFPGSGLSPKCLYPASSRELAERILRSGGALVSPFGLEQGGADWTFPSRNRLMAGISHAVLIIEARKGSGTLLTSDYAADFGRDILAVLGPIDSELSYGPHMLLKAGATPVRTADDILECLGISKDSKDFLGLAGITLTDKESKILAQLRISSATSTDLIEKTRIDPQEFNIIVSKLEMMGLIRESGGCFRCSI